MTQLLTQVKERRRQVWEQAKSHLDTIEREGRQFTGEADATWTRLNTELDSLDRRLVELEADEKRNAAADTVRANFPGGPSLSAGEQNVDQQFRAAILQNSRTPIDILDPARRGAHQPGVERRSLTTTNLTGVTFWNKLQAHMVDSSAVLAAGATLITTESGETLKVPKSTAQSTAAIVTEGATISTSDPTLGVATLGSYKYGFLTSISTELAQDAQFDVVGYLAEMSGQAIGNAAGAHFVGGTGTSQPRGILADTTAGVTGGTAVAGAFTADNLIDLYFSVIAPYSRSASAAWLMRTTTLGAIRKLKDSQNRYLFDADVPAGTGASGKLLGRLVYCDPNVPAVALSAKSVVFGDVSKYWVRQVNGLRFERSEDFGFNADLVYFRGLARLDCTMVDTTGALKHFVGGAS